MISSYTHPTPTPLSLVPDPWFPSSMGLAQQLWEAHVNSVPEEYQHVWLVGVGGFAVSFVTYWVFSTTL